jgi:hypothetical protein
MAPGPSQLVAGWCGSLLACLSCLFHEFNADYKGEPP